MRKVLMVMFVLLCGAGISGRAQETTAAVQGTITDKSGAAVVGAVVTASSPVLGIPATSTTDSHGFYRVSALPPGTYTLVVAGQGMKATATDLKLNAGDLPDLNLKLSAVGTDTMINVTDSVALVDTTQSKVETVITQEQIDALPKSGRSFQALLTLAPGVRQEPLQSLGIVNGSSAPNAAGNANIGGGNSRLNGFQVDGASDSENLYMLDGVNITNIQGGGIGLNVPGEFFQQVSIKSGAIEAQYGGALGGVINVIPSRGTNNWHGSVALQYRSSFMDANDQCGVSTVCNLRYKPGTSANAATGIDATAEYYVAQQDHYRYVDPSFRMAGPLFTDKLFLLASYAPDFQRTRRDAVSTFVGNAGPHTYYNSADTHAAVMRLDYTPTSNLRLFASWDYNFIRIVGQLPTPDSKTGQTNSAVATNPATFRPDGGFANPISVYSAGLDYTLGSKTLISARFGYLFNNTHTLGTGSGLRYLYSGSASASTPTFANPTPTATNPAIPAAYQNQTTFSNLSANQPTFFNTYKRKAINVDISHLQSGWAGMHNFKGGYQFVRTGNNVKQIYDFANVTLYYGTGQSYSPGTSPTACDAIIAANQASFGVTNASKNCTGNYGYFIVHDGTDVLGSVNSNAHGLYVQDDWTVAHSGLTINAGVRIDREYIPPYVAGDPSITFGWGSKLAPRIGGAYDLLHNGKIKLFASYGKYFDILKFSLPQGSFGGNYWHDCVYTLDNPNYNLITPTAPVSATDGFRHSCPVTGMAPGVGTNAVTDTGSVAVPLPTGPNNGRFIENIDLRATNNSTDDPGVDPNIKPTSQHEYEVGAEYAMTPSLSFSSRYVHKSLDSTTEDMGLNDTYGFYIGNPGSGYGDLLHRALPNVYRAALLNNIPNAAQFNSPTGICPTCPSTPAASRVYDGLEFRVEKRAAKYQVTAFYTYSRLYGNYPGLTSTFITDGAGGRHNPNNNRSFDLPNMQFTAAGKPFGGPLPTDRPNSLTVFGFRRLKTFAGETTFGITQIASSGTPVSSCLGLLSTASSCQFIEDQGHFVNLSVGAGGKVVKGSVDQRRTPAFTQTSTNIGHYVHVSKDHENRRFGGEFNVNNLLNQHSVVSYNVTPTTSTPTIKTTGNVTGTDYYTLMTGFDYMAVINGTFGTATNGSNSPKILSSQYGQPNGFQTSRSVRWKIAYQF